MDLKSSDGCSSSSGLKRKSEDVSSDGFDSSVESESEPEEECDVDWDLDCKILNVTVSNGLTGFHLMPTCLPESTSAKKICCRPTLLTHLTADKFIDDFKLKWKMNEALCNDNVEIITDPWTVCVINQFLEDDYILYNVRQEFYELDWNRRKLDLYDFHQSRDLKYIDSHYIQLLYLFLKNDVMDWVSRIMNVELNAISATCSFYSDTDYLLVHDDKQEDRVVAFVLYLSGGCNWEQSWGGALQLFNTDNNAQPLCPSRDIFPKHNQLVLFPVSNISYHQVAEVTAKNYSRLSINGWFHGTNSYSHVTPIFKTPLKGLYSVNSITPMSVDLKLRTWINNEYLQKDVVGCIHQQIEENSEISLCNFLNDEKFKSVQEALSSQNIKWNLQGPPNRLHYEVLDEDSMSVTVSEFINLFKSEQIFELLHKYTELDLHKNGATMRYELQRWSSGCYSLLSEYDWESKHELDVIMYFGSEVVVGGQIQYINEEEEINDALITLSTVPNTLNIVFRDTARITHYVSKHTKKPFYVLLCSYTEAEETD